MSLRYHEIAEEAHRLLNPITHVELMELGEVCRLTRGLRQLDLACGKGEMLCLWAQRWGTTGLGVDISKVFLRAARERAAELGLTDRVAFAEGDAGKYQADGKYDIVSCIGATWIGGGLAGAIDLMLPALEQGGLLLIGEPYWRETPPFEAYASAGVAPEEFTSLEGTLDRFEAAGLNLVEMVLANEHTWDRYVAPQWWTVERWLRENPSDPDAAGIAKWIAAEKRDYFRYGRRYLGWGIFALRVK